MPTSIHTCSHRSKRSVLVCKVLSVSGTCGTGVCSRRNAKRVGDKKIYLLTDAGSEYSDDGLEQICAGLREKNIELIVV